MAGKIKFCLHLALFFLLVLTLPVLLYISEHDASPPPVSGGGELPVSFLDLPRGPDFFALLYPIEKDANLLLPAKEKPGEEVEAEVEEIEEEALVEVPAPASEAAPTTAPAPEPSPAQPPNEEEERRTVSREDLKERVEPVRPSPPASSGSPAAKEQQMVDLVNEARRSAGLSPLQVSSSLTGVARAKSADMIANNYFGHHSPTYGSLSSLLSNYGIRYRRAGENLAMNSDGSVVSAHRLLMNSASHRANILQSAYTQIGVGIAVRADGAHYYTQIFVGR